MDLSDSDYGQLDWENEDGMPFWAWQEEHGGDASQFEDWMGKLAWSDA
jgi:hypothetical protein